MKHSVFAAILIFTTSNCCLAYGNTNSTYVFNKSAPWHLVVSLGGGVAVSSSNTSASKTFPIVNPVSDEFFVYSANNAAQTVGMTDAFIGAEWAFRSNWSMQMGVGYNQVWNFAANGTLYQGADNQSANFYNYHYNILTRQVLAEGKLLYRYRDRYLPYFFIGLGGVLNEASEYGTNVPPFLTFTRQYQDNTQTSFSYAIGAGIDVDILDNLRLGVGYRFTDLGEAKLGPAVIDTTSVNGTLSSTHIYANEILAQITWLI